MSKTKSHDKPGAAKELPVKVFRHGAVAASIWKRQTPTGFEYLDFSLTRSWKLKNSDKEAVSQNFFDKNEQDLKEAVSDACRFIRSQQQVVLSTANGAVAPTREGVDRA